MPIVFINFISGWLAPLFSVETRNLASSASICNNRINSKMLKTENWNYKYLTLEFCCKGQHLAETVSKSFSNLQKELNKLQKSTKPTYAKVQMNPKLIRCNYLQRGLKMDIQISQIKLLLTLDTLTPRDAHEMYTIFSLT